MMFAFELDRRARAASTNVSVLAAHPGTARTALLRSVQDQHHSATASWTTRLVSSLSQSAEQGALPQLYAATSPNVQGGQYIGPSGILETRGGPYRAVVADVVHDRQAARELWSLTRRLTATEIPLPDRLGPR